MDNKQIVNVNAENGKYDVEIGENLLQNYCEEKPYAVVTDDCVYDLYGKYFNKDRVIVLKQGEASKSVSNLELIYNKLFDMGIGRKDTLIALGGGVVGDIAGFAAATFKRGMGFVQIPTTLLAQVDSSVGGKVAVNLEKGKNMVGAFYQPQKVLADVGTLDTLDSRQYAAGMAEIIKYSMIADENLYQKLLTDDFDISEIIADCCRIKARYVQEDPFDLGVRMQLNYGHTIGHAIETVAGYGVYLHGEAVAIGMVLAAQIGEAIGVSPAGLKEKTIKMNEKYNLPTYTDKKILVDAMNILGADKKAEGESVPFILIDKIGHAVIKKFTVDELKKAVEESNQ